MSSFSFVNVFFSLLISFSASGNPREPKKNESNCIHPWFKKLIVGIENEFRVIVKDYDNEKLNVRISAGGQLKVDNIASQSNIIYKIIPDGSQKSITISVSTKPGDSLVCSSTFKVITPKVFIASQHAFELDGQNSVITKKQVLKASKVTLKLAKYAHYKIIRYDFAISSKTGSSAIFQMQDDNIASELKQHLKTLNSGDLLIIANVSVMGPNGPEMISGKTWTVK